MKILAIDPGYDRMGVAVLEGGTGVPVCVWSDCVLPPKGTSEVRLAFIHKKTEEIIKIHTPDKIALETLFFSTNNKRSAFGVAEARGVVLACAGIHGLPVSEHSPQQVKLAVTGYGNADKKAIALMISRLISLPARRRLDDEIDAIALGVCALSTHHPR